MNEGPSCKPGFVGKVRCAFPQLVTLAVLATLIGLAAWLSGP